MKNIFNIGLLILVLCLGSANSYAQDKKVTIRRLEVDGKLVRSDFKVEIVTGDKEIYRAKTDESGFVVPREVVAKSANTFVGVIIKFKRYVLPFFTVHTSNFDTAWIVGVDTTPFDPKFLSESDNSSEIQSIYYIEFDGEPSRNLIVKVGKPKVTIQRINDD